MECSICLEPLNDRTIELRCGHIFHGRCIIDHIKAGPSLFGDRYCPLCRAKLPRHDPSLDEMLGPLVEPPVVLESYGVGYCEPRGVMMIIIKPRIFQMLDNKC